jgi:hypothetical protein
VHRDQRLAGDVRPGRDLLHRDLEDSGVSGGTAREQNSAASNRRISATLFPAAATWTVWHAS